MRLKTIMMAMPVANHGTVPVDTIVSLRRLEVPYGFVMAEDYHQNSAVHIGRDEISVDAINGGYDYVLWVDSDMVFDKDALCKLMECKKDVVTGLYVQRAGNHDLVCYEHTDDDGRPNLICDTNTDRVHEVDAFGFGFCLIKTEVLKAVWDRFGTCFAPVKGFGEDIQFCRRARSLGYKLYACIDVQCGHIGQKIFYP